MAGRRTRRPCSPLGYEIDNPGRRAGVLQSVREILFNVVKYAGVDGAGETSAGETGKERSADLPGEGAGAGDRSTVRVYVVEDHFEMRSVLVDFLSADPGFTVLGAAATAEEALQWLENEDTGRGPELLLVVDLSLPGMNGIQLVSRVGERWPGVDCVMLSGHGQKAQAREALDAGARGYVVKGNPGELADALRQVRSGKIFLTESLR